MITGYRVCSTYLVSCAETAVAQLRNLNNSSHLCKSSELCTHQDYQIIIYISGELYSIPPVKSVGEPKPMAVPGKIVHLVHINTSVTIGHNLLVS